MSVDRPTGTDPAGADAGPDAAAVADPVSRLRELVRAGEVDDGVRLRELLGQLSDPLEVEAAGTLLRGRKAWAQLTGAAGFADTRVAVLGNSTLDPLPGLLTAVCVRRGIVPQVRLAGFDQWRLEVLSGGPELSDLRPRLVACLLDDSAVLAGVPDPTDVEQLAARCAEFPAELAQWVPACREALGGLVVLATVPLSPLRRHRLISFADRSRLDAAWLRMNAAIAELADGAGTVVLSAPDLAGAAGATFADDRMRHLAAHAYAPEYLLAYAEELARVAAADLGRAGKCLVLDLDETLWGGVVGETGAAGLRLGGGYPGSAHTELQALARDLSRQGVLLAVCSKNDESVAVDAVADHPEMLLRPDSFAARRINWQAKPDNLRAIAEELNLGADSLVFVDDNVVERDQMRRLAPEVVTVDLPAEPAGYATRLATRGDFAVLTVTAEDRDRAASYRAEADRRELVRSTGSLAEYLSSLGQRLTVEPLRPANTDRIAQLFARTNQFNLTGVRYGAGELTRRGDDRSTAFFAVRLVDRFGDNGLIAAVALSAQPDGAWHIENMVLSCRVFGRGVEDAIVGLILRDAAGQGASAVTARFSPTDRNTRFADFYPRLGFREAEPTGRGGYRHQLRDLVDIPVWIDIDDDREVFSVH